MPLLYHKNLGMNLLPTLGNTTFTAVARILTIFILLLTADSFAQAIWSNPITGTNPGQTTPYTAGDVRDPNITVSGISRVGVSGNDANDRYNTRGWNGGLSLTKYIEFTLTPNAGYEIDFSSFTYTGQVSGTGPMNFAFRSSVDGFASNIGVASAAGTTISLGAAAYQNRTTATTFRFYAYNASAAGGTFSINDFAFNGSVNATCASVTLTSVVPNNGPVGTEVTISAAAGLTGATATFAGIPAPIVSSSDTQLVVTVPTGATTNNLVVKNAALCASGAVLFTVIDKVTTGCEGSTFPSELFISEVTDSNYGSLTYIEIFNGTGGTKLLSNYSVRIANNGAAYQPSNIITLPAISLPSGGVYVIAVGIDGTVCSSPGGNGSYADLNPSISTSVNFTTNQHDHIGLFNGATLIDSWGIFGATTWAPAFIGASGATFRRKNTASPLPNATYTQADWDIIDFAGTGSDNCANNDYSDIGVFATFKNPPIVTLQPNAVVNCTTTAVSLSVSGTEGVANGAPLAYQWYGLPAGSNTWILLNNAGVYSGVTTATLTISNIAAVNNYQYYCQIRENTASCYTATNATIVKDVYVTTWTGSWSNGLPSLTKRAIMAANYDTAIDGSFECCSLTVNAGNTVNISPSDYISIQNNLTVNGTLTVADDASLVQISDTGVNTGSVTVRRAATIKKYDYVYWSAPVANFAVTGVSPGTGAGFIFKWLPTQAGNFGTWTTASENMVAGKGYIVRSPSVWPTTLTPFTANFSGVPNNGIITPAIERGSYTGANYPSPTNPAVLVTNKDDNWNLLGNPYPSSIRALDFLTANANIEGAVRLWTHGAVPVTGVSDPFYGNFMYNYNSNDYIVYNGTATTSGPTGFNGYIASGQAFFVQMNDGPASTQTVTFNNAMRNKSYGNAQFYRQTVESVEAARNVEGEQDKSRIWLDLVGPTQTVSRTVVGYVDGATFDKDRMYDAHARRDDSQNFYSLINGEPMAIQGRPTPLDPNDKVAVGVNVTAAGTYTIAIAAVDGAFDQTEVYLDDKELGILHNLKQAPYVFLAAAGASDTRFELRYTDSALATADFENTRGVAVIANQQAISVRSYSAPIAEVTVYDIIGRQIVHRAGVNALETELRGIQATQQALVIKIKLQDGVLVTRKIMM